MLCEECIHARVESYQDENNEEVECYYCEVVDTIIKSFVICSYFESD